MDLDGGLGLGYLREKTVTVRCEVISAELYLVEDVLSALWVELTGLVPLIFLQEILEMRH